MPLRLSFPVLLERNEKTGSPGSPGQAGGQARRGMTDYEIYDEECASGLVHRPTIKGSDLNHHNDPIPERWFMPDLVW